MLRAWAAASGRRQPRRVGGGGSMKAGRVGAGVPLAALATATAWQSGVERNAWLLPWGGREEEGQGKCGVFSGPCLQ